MAEDGLTPGVLTPEQIACIRQATQALEKLQGLIPVPEEKSTNLSPEEAFLKVTHQGRVTMTPRMFEEAVAMLGIVHKKYPDCKQCGWPVYNFTDRLCTSCLNRMFP